MPVGFELVIRDVTAWFSNFGKCNDVYAPAEAIWHPQANGVMDYHGRDWGSSLVMRSLGTSYTSPRVASMLLMLTQAHFELIQPYSTVHHLEFCMEPTYGETRDATNVQNFGHYLDLGHPPVEYTLFMDRSNLAGGNPERKLGSASIQWGAMNIFTGDSPITGAGADFDWIDSIPDSVASAEVRAAKKANEKACTLGWWHQDGIDCPQCWNFGSMGDHQTAVEAWEVRYVSRVMNRPLVRISSEARSHTIEYDKVQLLMLMRGALMNRVEAGVTSSGTIWYKGLGTVGPDRMASLCGGGTTVDGYQPNTCIEDIQESYELSFGRTAGMYSEDHYKCVKQHAHRCCPLCKSVVLYNTQELFCRYPNVNGLKNQMSDIPDYGDNVNSHSIVKRLGRVTNAFFAMKKLTNPILPLNWCRASVSRNCYYNADPSSWSANSRWLYRAENWGHHSNAVTQYNNLNQRRRAHWHAACGTDQYKAWGETDLKLDHTHPVQYRGTMIQCYDKQKWDSGTFPPKEGSTYFGWMWLSQSWPSWSAVDSSASASAPSWTLASSTQFRYHSEMRRLYAEAVRKLEGHVGLHPNVCGGGYGPNDCTYGITFGGDDAEVPSNAECPDGICRFDRAVHNTAGLIGELGCIGGRFFQKPDCKWNEHVSTPGNWRSGNSFGSDTEARGSHATKCWGKHHKYLQARLHCVMRMLNAVAAADNGCKSFGSSNDDYENNRYNCLCRRRNRYNLVAKPPPRDFGIASKLADFSSMDLCDASNHMVPGCPENPQRLACEADSNNCGEHFNCEALRNSDPTQPTVENTWQDGDDDGPTLDDAALDASHGQFDAIGCSGDYDNYETTSAQVGNNPGYDTR